MADEKADPLTALRAELDAITARLEKAAEGAGKKLLQSQFGERLAHLKARLEPNAPPDKAPPAS